MQLAWQTQRLVNNSSPVQQLFRTISLPKSLDSVVSIDEDSEVAPMPPA